MSPASSFGSRSAIQTSRQRRGPSAKTCTDALWWLSRPPRADQASRRASSSRSTMSSRTIMPLPKVTTRASASRRVSTTNPGTSRVCSAPTSRTAAQTFSALVSSAISLRMLAMMTSSRRRSSYARRGEPVLENLAIASGQAAEATGRDPGRAVEGAHEVREVTESDVERDVRDRAFVAGQEARGVAEAAADQILVRRHADDVGEDSQEVERAEPGLARHCFEIERLVRVRIDPERRFQRAPAVTALSPRALSLHTGDHVDDAGGEQHPDLIEAGVAPSLGNRLGQLAQHHQLGQRRDAARQPDVAPAADRFDELRRQVKGEAFVGISVVMRAGVLVAGVTDQDRPGHELE